MYICEMWLFDSFFLNSANLIYRSTDIIKFFRGPFDFEITRVDCILHRNPCKQRVSELDLHCLHMSQNWVFSLNSLE